MPNTCTCKHKGEVVALEVSQMATQAATQRTARVMAQAATQAET